ncbi:hypothetical protein NQ318_015665 [Aromia moschata]|uniref:RanBD1 domain-containing protein n=1 Tax=Aromia moschata TaxID=1265417 RepID=A0AAV8XRH6_9CUCU|nr:hypothetical protein NQ318_015665 [Aromia moschata]
MAESQKNVCENVIKPATLQPPIIMKIDGPSEETEDKEVDDNERNSYSLKSREEIKACNPSFRSSTTSTSNPFASSQNKLARGILKPPQLSLNNSVLVANNKPFILKPSQLQFNPFGIKPFDNGDKVNSEKTENGDCKKNQVNGEMPKFVPLIVPENKAKNTAPITSNQSSTTSSVAVPNSSFIFGQNLQDRVIAVETKGEPKASSSLNPNSYEMSFSSAVNNEINIENLVKENEGKSLSESAREYEESRANKRKYEEVEIITGEEQENNILKISCKLFSFDKNSGSWQERGRGTLRLNDFEIDGHLGSRLVFRTAGSLRVILNTKIWAEMTIDKASEKSIRLTALDANGEIKVFLIMTNIEDSHKLFSHLQIRLEREVTAQKRKKS